MKRSQMKNKIKMFTTVLFMGMYLFSCNTPEPKYYDEYIKILYTDFEIETPIGINCDSFDNYFKGSIDSVLITDPKNILKLISEIESLQLIDTNYYSEPDTRAKIVIKLKNKPIYTVCLDFLVVKYQKNSYKNSENFRSLILKLFKNKKR
jgi:hypothetical protein